MNKKYFFLLTLLFAFLGGVKSYSINTNAGIVAKQIYSIRAKDAGRGILYAGNASGSAAHAEGHISTAGSSSYGTSTGYGDFANIAVNPSGNTFQQFAFIEVGGSYYLYSVGARALLCVSGGKLYFSTTSFEAITLTACTRSLWTNYALLKFNSANKFLTFSNGSGHQHGINLQASIAANTNDEGCALNIAAVNGATLSDDELLYAQDLIDHRITNSLATAENFLNTTTATQVGYPKAPARATLQDAIDVYKPFVQQSNVTAAEYNPFAAALTAYLSDTNVNMPEEGKAYTFTFKHMNGTRTYLYWDGNNRKITSAVLGTGAALPETATFVCHKEGSKYMFVNPSSGNYLVWWGGSGDGAYESNNGFTSAYDSGKNLFQVVKFLTGDNVQATNEELFGCVGLKGTRSSGDAPYFILKNTAGGAVASSAPYVDKTTTNAYYRSCAVMIEEVDYYNKIVFRSPATPDGKYYASIYLPYAATVPTGATAYLGTLNGSSIRLTDIGGTVIPKNTAVVMVAESDLATQYIAPATEVGALPAGVTNNLEGTLTTTETTNSTFADTYVLNGSFGNIGFYKYTATNLPKGRAYFEVRNSGVQGVQGFLFDFGEEGSETTGINAATLSEGNAAKTYYDLSGRRIANPKNGLYICNGKKVYIK